MNLLILLFRIFVDYLDFRKSNFEILFDFPHKVSKIIFILEKIDWFSIFTVLHQSKSASMTAGVSAYEKLG
jgi:hypothetical protein